MEIYFDDYADILDYLKNERWEEGMEYVAYLMENVVHKEQLSTFIDHYEAQEYCHEMSTDYDLYACLPIRSVYRAMEAGLKDTSLIIDKDGIVDVAAMVNLYYERLTAMDLINTEHRENVRNEQEKEQAESLQKQLGYVDIVGVQVEDIIALIRSPEKNPAYEYSLYLDNEGNYVEEGREYEHRLDLKLKCRIDDEKDRIYFERYDCAVCLKDQAPVKLSQSVSYGNTLKPLELFKMVKNDTAIEREFYDSYKNEFCKSFAYIDPNQTDKEGNLLIVKKQIDVDKLIRNSNIANTNNIFVRLLIHNCFARGEMAKVTIDLDGEKKEVLVKLMPLDNSLSYFDKVNMEPIQVSLKNDNGAQSLENNQTLGNDQSQGKTSAQSTNSKQEKINKQAEKNSLVPEKKSPAKMMSRRKRKM